MALTPEQQNLLNQITQQAQQIKSQVDILAAAQKAGMTITPQTTVQAASNYLSSNASPSPSSIKITTSPTSPPPSYYTPPPSSSPPPTYYTSPTSYYNQSSQTQTSLPSTTTKSQPTNLYEYYTQQGKPLPSISERAALYQQAGLGPATSYLGTEKQNTQLLKYLLGQQSTGAGVITTQSTKPANPVEGSTYDDTQAGIRYRYTNGQWQPIQSIPKVSTSGESSSKQASGAVTFDVDVQEYMRKWGIQGTPEDYARSIGIKNYTGTIDQKAQIINDIAKKGPAGLLNTNPIAITSEGANTQQTTTTQDVNKDIQDEIAYYSNIKTLNDLKKSLGIDDSDKPKVPNLSSDLLQLRNQYGIDAIESRINDLNKLISDTEASLRQGIYNEEGKLQPMTLMSTREQALRRQAQEQLDTYNREKASLVEEYNTKLSLINNIMTLEDKDYENAKAAYDTNFTQALQLQQLLVSSTDKAQDNARANLTLLTNFIKDRNLSWDQLSPDTQLLMDKLSMQAGIPSGVMELFLKSKPINKLLAHGKSTDADGREFVYLVSQDPETGMPTTTKIYTGGTGSSGTGTIKLTSLQKSQLLGMGFTTQGINDFQADLNAGYTLDQILEAQTDLTDEQKNQIRSIFDKNQTIEQQAMADIQQYKDLGYTREEAEQNWMASQKVTKIPPKIAEIFDAIYPPPPEDTRSWWQKLLDFWSKE